MIVKELIRYDCPVAKPEHFPEEVVDLMDNYKISQIPYIDNEGNYMALLEDVQVDEMNFEMPLSEQTKNIFFNPYAIEKQHIMDVLSLFGHNNLSILPVLNEQKLYVGALMAEDLLSKIGAMFDFVQESAIIVLEIAVHDYSLSQIAQIIESNDAKILQLFVSEINNSDFFEIIIRINQANVHRILQAFYRYNYTVKNVFSSFENTDDLKDRFSLLMKMINI